MTAPWGEVQTIRLLPPPVQDLRGMAFARTLDHLLAQPDLLIRRTATCPQAVLPARIAEYGLDDFVEPGMDEAILRQILAHAWRLQEVRGYDRGGKPGLELPGMRAVVRIGIRWCHRDPPIPII